MTLHVSMRNTLKFHVTIHYLLCYNQLVLIKHLTLKCKTFNVGRFHTKQCNGKSRQTDICRNALLLFTF